MGASWRLRIARKSDQKQVDEWPGKGARKDTYPPPRRQPVECSRPRYPQELARYKLPALSRPLPHPSYAKAKPVVATSLWNQCLRRLEAELPEQHFNTWIRPLQAVEDDGRLRLLAPNRYVVDWVNQNCADRIGELLGELVPPPIPEFIVEVGSRRLQASVSTMVAAPRLDGRPPR